MIVCVLENPAPADPFRKNVDVELRIMIKGLTLEEGETIGEAIGEFAASVGRKLSAFSIDKEMLAS